MTTPKPVMYHRKKGMVEGKGFSLEELKRAGVSVEDAKKLGIPIDEYRIYADLRNVETLTKFLKELGR